MVPTLAMKKLPVSMKLEASLVSVHLVLLEMVLLVKVRMII